MSIETSLSDFVDKILVISKPEIINIEERAYTNKTLAPVYDPVPKNPIIFKSLQGLVDYINSNVDALDMAELMVHVESPASVIVYGCLTEKFLQRPVYAKSEYRMDTFNFNAYQSIDKTIVGLQSHFVMTGELKELIRLLGSIVDSDVREVSDDTISQSVVVKTGVSMKDRAKLPNPITLNAFRTFSEVEQPEGNYVVRLAKDGHDKGLPTVALFDSGGEGWKLDAMLNIKNFLSYRITDKNLPILA